MTKAIKGKFYGPNPQALQDVADRIQNEFMSNCVVSRTLPSTKGDYHILVTIYENEKGSQEYEQEP